MHSRSLPPLDLLVPFEAAARLESFTRAADELNVTQSAVSQRVRTLEDHLGVALFDREHRRITLTAQGRELLNGATVALNHLAAATQSVKRTEREQPLRLAVDSAIAEMWLMPRLRRYRALYPEISVDLTVSDRRADNPVADVAIFHGSGDWPRFESTKLFEDEIFPVCAPGYLDRHKINSAADLLTADLIDLDYQHWDWMNWGIWLTESGLDPTDARRAFQSNSYSSVIAAARDGWGVALGWRHFMDDDLARGTLIRPLTEQVTTRFGYFLALRTSAPPEASRFGAWLLADEKTEARFFSYKRASIFTDIK